MLGQGLIIILRIIIFFLNRFFKTTPIIFIIFYFWRNIYWCLRKLFELSKLTVFIFYRRKQIICPILNEMLIFFHWNVIFFFRSCRLLKATPLVFIIFYFWRNFHWILRKFIKIIELTIFLFNLRKQIIFYFFGQRFAIIRMNILIFFLYRFFIF